MTILVEKGDLTKISCDAIVNPANPFVYMVGGVADTIKKIGGSITEKDAVSKAPIPVGSAIVTIAGLGAKLKLKSIALPCMGTDVGGIPKADATKVITELVKEYEDKFEKIILIDRNDEMVRSFNRFQV